ncbi:pentapeptide repeat-containing protein [uncultured Roseibium sp.]|uniref:pentapeptide repeat-containing protein n=1 Tax=uncultured Roseibium sp. TaxID=1936171 RepID=UPI002596D4AC|nr:pentapeptide repeat-containing protein [uncultured Roseibium sp.]
MFVELCQGLPLSKLEISGEMRTGNLKGCELRFKGEKPSFVDWIGFRSELDYVSFKPLGHVVGTLILLIGLAVAAGGLLTLVQFLLIVFQPNADHEAIRNIGLVVAAVFGAPFIFWRALVAQKQADTAEQSHITDQINKAVAGLGAEKTVDRIGRPINVNAGKFGDLTHLVDDIENFKLPARSIELKRYQDVTYLNVPDEVFEGWHVEVRTWEEDYTKIEWQKDVFDIGDGEAVAERGAWTVFSESVPNIEVRVGAIYALERIAQDSLRDHIQIMEILTAYIRENAPVKNLAPSQEPFFRAQPRTDVQAALDVIGRRSAEHIHLEQAKKFRLDLRKVDLSGANFERGNFEGALLVGSRLEASRFRQANLSGARLQRCLLNFADFYGTNLCGAILDHCTINSLDAWNGSFTSAANTQGMSVAGADITAVSHLSLKETRAPTFGTKDTKLTYHLEKKREDLAPDLRQFSYTIHNEEIEDKEEMIVRLREAGFLYWSPFDSDDGATSSLRNALWTSLELKGFPFEDE